MFPVVLSRKDKSEQPKYTMDFNPAIKKEKFM